MFHYVVGKGLHHFFVRGQCLFAVTSMYDIAYIQQLKYFQEQCLPESQLEIADLDILNRPSCCLGKAEDDAFKRG